MAIPPPAPDRRKYHTIRWFTKPVVKKVIKTADSIRRHDGLNSFIQGRTNPLPDDTLKLLKNNTEATNSDELNKIVFPTVNADEINLEWANFTFPKKFRGSIYSVMSPGGYYKPHIDAARLGHFSTTIFLSDPSTYEGGELELLVDGKLKEFKLKPGYGITYETGTPHQVKTVTSGERKVLIFWTTTQMVNLEDLYQWRAWKLWAQKQVPGDIEKLGYYPIDSDDVAATLEEFVAKKPVIAVTHMHEIVRKYI